MGAVQAAALVAHFSSGPLIFDAEYHVPDQSKSEEENTSATATHVLYSFHCSYNILSILLLILHIAKYQVP